MHLARQAVKKLTVVQLLYATAGNCFASHQLIAWLGTKQGQMQVECLQLNSCNSPHHHCALCLLLSLNIRHTGFACQLAGLLQANLVTCTRQSCIKPGISDAVLNS